MAKKEGPGFKAEGGRSTHQQDHHSPEISADGHAQADSLHVELAQQLQKAPLSYLAGLGAVGRELASSFCPFEKELNKNGRTKEEENFIGLIGNRPEKNSFETSLTL
ncbi:hypothetical protein Y1Q_0010666 [Alligator mississippiensis]|uniref:Uncharacterized protein n=1 Tax=Alligator mississippiensis TaxID=8496 RepID=A0A151M6D1_ALLMI|nr:hypothetical protein Y1Q_0010666 [Alligator mississippiensis]